MTELLREWIMGLCAASVITACAQSIVPGGAVKKVLRLICGIVLTMVLISPLTGPNQADYAFSLASYRDRVAALTEELSETEKRLDRMYIEERCAAYILDEAHALGLEGRVEVSAKWRDDCWVPWELWLSMTGPEEQRLRLTAQITAELGIAAERQHWIFGW